MSRLWRWFRPYWLEMRGNALWDLAKVLGALAIATLSVGAYAAMAVVKSLPFELRWALALFAASLLLSAVALAFARRRGTTREGLASGSVQQPAWGFPGIPISHLRALEDLAEGSATSAASQRPKLDLLVSTFGVHSVGAYDAQIQLRLVNRSKEDRVALTFALVIHWPSGPDLVLPQYDLRDGLRGSLGPQEDSAGTIYFDWGNGSRREANPPLPLGVTLRVHDAISDGIVEHEVTRPFPLEMAFDPHDLVCLTEFPVEAVNASYEAIYRLRLRNRTRTRLEAVRVLIARMEPHPIQGPTSGALLRHHPEGDTTFAVEVGPTSAYVAVASVELFDVDTPEPVIRVETKSEPGLFLDSHTSPVTVDLTLAMPNASTTRRLVIERRESVLVASLVDAPGTR